MRNPTQEIPIGGVVFTVTMLDGGTNNFNVSWSGGVLVMRLGNDASGFLTATPLDGHGKAFERLPPSTLEQLIGGAAGIRGRSS